MCFVLNLLNNKIDQKDRYLWKGVKNHIFGGHEGKNTWEDLETFLNVFPKVDFVLCFCCLCCLFVWHLLCWFSCFPKLSCTESTAPITLIRSVNILTSSVGLLYLSFSQMYNLTPPRQPASPHHLRLLCLALITWQRILQCSEIRN